MRALPATLPGHVNPCNVGAVRNQQDLQCESLRVPERERGTLQRLLCLSYIRRPGNTG